MADAKKALALSGGGGAGGARAEAADEEIGGVKLKRRHNLSAPKGVNGRNSDNTLIKKIFNWEPSTRLRDGLERTYRWIYDDMVARRAGASAALASSAN